MLIDFIRLFPYACFSPEVVMAFSEAITFLHAKIGKEFDSKSHIMHSKHLKYMTLLHTDSKVLTKTVIFLMNCITKLVFRGLLIDHNFMKVLILHLIKQETTLMSTLPFGYKFLKYVITSFRIDVDAFRDHDNPYFWITREGEFHTKLT
jgi:phosphatidylinositol 4-kinase